MQMDFGLPRSFGGENCRYIDPTKMWGKFRKVDRL